MKRLVTSNVLAAVLLLATVDASAGAKPTKADLAHSYKPVTVNGMPWYRGAQAAKLHNERRGREARPIVCLRILGELDGGT